MSVVRPVTGSRPGRLAVLVALALATAACGNDTGILLEVHKGEGVASEVYRLKVFVGVGHDAELFDPAWWTSARLDADVAETMLDGEMAGETYRILLRPGADLPGDGDLVFAVAGFKNATETKPVVFGHTTTPIRFADAQIRVLDLPLEIWNDARHGLTGTGCVWWNTTNDRVKRDAIVPKEDGDCDAYKEGHDENAGCQLDCADDDPAIHPGVTEICDNGIDENCCDDNDGKEDLDGDGFATCGSGEQDCLDGPRGGPGRLNVFGDNVPPEEIHPGAVELCDGVDNNCSNSCDEVESFDGDGDGYLNCVREEDGAVAGSHRLAEICLPSRLDCADSGTVGNLPASAINPGAVDDQCDNIDNDCDGTCDQALVGQDLDDDGFDGCTTLESYINPAVPVCGRAPGQDCDADTSPYSYPGGAERCDGVDFDCDGILFPDVSPCFVLVTEGSSTTCQLGRRTCDDTPGSGNAGFGTCTHDVNAADTVLDPGLCDISCADTDPIQCVTGSVPHCDVHFQVVGGNGTPNPCLMPPTEVTLATSPDTGGCNYTLIGGGVQGDWAVILVNPQGGTGLTAIGCGSKLRVTAARPDAEDRTVMVVSGVGAQFFQLRRVDACDPQGNMVCN